MFKFIAKAINKGINQVKEGTGERYDGSQLDKKIINYT